MTNIKDVNIAAVRLGKPRRAGPEFPEKFELGRIFLAPDASSVLTDEDIEMALRRHQSGDWGLVDDYESTHNDIALGTGEALLSEYESENGQAFVVRTEADRSMTIILLVPTS